MWTFFHLHRNHWIPWELLFCHDYIWSRQKRFNCIWKLFQTLRKIWYVWTFFHFYWNHFGSMGIIILICVHMVAPLVLSVYMKKPKKYQYHENSFKRWEKYGICERSFIFIEIIGFHGNNYFVLITYGRAEGALTVYEKIKNIGIMKTLSNVEKNMVYLNILSFS